MSREFIKKDGTYLHYFDMFLLEIEIDSVVLVDEFDLSITEPTVFSGFYPNRPTSFYIKKSPFPESRIDLVFMDKSNEEIFRITNAVSRDLVKRDTTILVSAI